MPDNKVTERTKIRRHTERGSYRSVVAYGLRVSSKTGSESIF